MNSVAHCQTAGNNPMIVEVSERMPHSGCRSDADIAEAVAKALLLTAGLTGDAVQGMVDRGVVTLDGEVGRVAQRNAAAEAARWIHGVVGVVNIIGIRSRNQVEAPGTLPDSYPPLQARIGSAISTADANRWPYSMEINHAGTPDMDRHGVLAEGFMR